MGVLTAEPRPASRRPKFTTVDDLLNRLGDIPPERVRMTPSPGMATVADLERPGNKLCELIDGTLVEKAVGWHESFLGSYLILQIGKLLEVTKLGIVTGPDGLYRLNPTLARAPDVAFIPRDRLPAKGVVIPAVPSLVPTLAIEVLSRSNTKKEMARKREDYFTAGVILVWEIDPKTRSAKAYTSPTEFTEYDEHGSLDAGSVLPGFSVSLAKLFAILDDLP